MTIRVFYALNDRFVGPTSVSLYTLLGTTRSNVEINFLRCGLSDDGLDVLRSVADLFENVTFKAHLLPDFFLNDRQVSDRRRPNLTKLLLPLLHDGRVLYMDGDTIVRKDVQEIYQVDLGENLIAASAHFRMVEKHYTSMNGRGFVFKKQIQAARDGLSKLEQKTGLSDARRYINSGVMVMDLDRIRESDSLADRLADFVSASKYSQPTQTWIAKNIGERVRILGPEWNMYSNGTRANYQFFPSEERVKYRVAVRDPAIVHFVGRSKPWRPFRLASLTEGFRWRRAYRQIAQEIKEQTGFDQFASPLSAPA